MGGWTVEWIIAGLAVGYVIGGYVERRLGKVAVAAWIEEARIADEHWVKADNERSKLAAQLVAMKKDGWREPYEGENEPITPPYSLSDPEYQHDIDRIRQRT
jgi:hypothetical protein